jgi:hypothetical protein
MVLVILLSWLNGPGWNGFPARWESTQKYNKYHLSYTRIYSVFTKEWCGFKNVLNDYMLQLDGAPAPIFTGMYESYSIVFSNSAGSDVLQMETTTYTYYMGQIRL